MKFEKGHKKAGGRTKGVPNKAGSTTKDILEKFANKNLSEIQELYDTLKPIDKLSYLEKILAYIIPKQRAIDANITTDSEINLLSDTQIDALYDKIKANGN